MGLTAYRLILQFLGCAFALAFTLVCVTPLIADPDVVAAAMAGFVNPYASGYALDAIFCWLVLTSWVVYEARTTDIRHGCIAVVLGVMPGVAAGLAFYLLLRLNREASSDRF